MDAEGQHLRTRPASLSQEPAMTALVVLTLVFWVALVVAFVLVVRYVRKSHDASTRAEMPQGRLTPR